MAKWYENSYCRVLIDNHITDTHPSFMISFNPETYVQKIKDAGFSVATVSACCHNGNCYYPTKIGHMHQNLKGRNIFGETVSLLRKNNIVPLGYYTVVFHNDSAKTNSDWRQQDHLARDSADRYWFSCLNHPGYRKFVHEQLKEIIAYDISGLFIDMTCWPWVCCCGKCRGRFLYETGFDIPSVIDWNDNKWIIFQRAREKWVQEFASEITSQIKSLRAELTVCHQFAGILGGWKSGLNSDFTKSSEYATGDFYGGKLQQSLGTKILSAFSENIPFEFQTSRTISLHDHTTSKSEDELCCWTATTLANGGACTFIDSVNPNGTLSDEAFKLFGRVNKFAKQFSDAIAKHRPVVTGNVGLYFSSRALIDHGDNGTDLRKTDIMKTIPSGEVRPLKEIVGVADLLSKNHIPYRVVTENTKDFADLKMIIVNSVQFMTSDEVEKLRNFVFRGGTLIATGMTSIADQNGQTTGDFLLKDVFGVSYVGRQSSKRNYLVLDHSPNYILCDYPSPLVKEISASLLGRVAEPFFETGDRQDYASIHSDPPGPTSEYAGLTCNNYGDGLCIYLYSSLLAHLNNQQQQFGGELIKKYLPKKILTTNAPSCVEIILLKSTTQDAYLLCFVNRQSELPNIPVFDLNIELNLPDDFMIRSARCISDFKNVLVRKINKTIKIIIPRLDILEIVEIEKE